MDMRDFLNAPNGLPQQTLNVNEKQNAESPQSPMGGRTVGPSFLYRECNSSYCFKCNGFPVLKGLLSCNDYVQDVFDLPFHMARDQIEESIRTKMSSIKVLFYQFFVI